MNPAQFFLSNLQTCVGTRRQACLIALALASASAVHLAHAQTRTAAPPALAASTAANAEGAPPRSTVAPAAGPAGSLTPHASGSDVFGTHLFTGAFAREGAAHFNPDYVLAVGDTVQVRLWGAYEHAANLAIDPQGNIFLPLVGPVALQGVRNQDLQSVIEAAVRRLFRSNVNSYASLAAAQPVRVFVGGFVLRPGLYSGTSMDGLLHYLDQAGGIDPERGSFLQVQVRRGDALRASVNLYDFLLQGRMPAVQLATGDVIFIPGRLNTIRVGGLAANPKRFEFSEAERSVSSIIAMARPSASATHVRVVRNTGTTRHVEYHPLESAGGVLLRNGDELEFTADKKPGTITVRVEGEHQSQQEFSLPYGSRLQDVLHRVQLNERSEIRNLQLFRQSVKQRQKEMLATSLRSLETALLTARSGSSDEAKLRAEEANLTLQWIDRAKQIEPLGQVLIADDPKKGDLLLENGDVVRIPAKESLVLVSGEVLFPNAVAFQRELTVGDYIAQAGGFTQGAETTRIVLARVAGGFDQVSSRAAGSGPRVSAGDQILVLPKVDDKQRQFWKDMTQIIYQIAVSARVVLGLY